MHRRCFCLSGTLGWKILGGHHTAVRPYYLHEENSPLELPRAIRPSTLKGCVGTPKDGYICNVPLPRVQRIQSASHDTSHELIAPSRCIQMGTPLPDYLPVSSWIPTLPKLGSLIGFSQKILRPFSPIAIKSKNNLLSSAHGFVESLEQSTAVATMAATPHRASETSTASRCFCRAHCPYSSLLSLWSSLAFSSSSSLFFSQNSPHKVGKAQPPRNCTHTPLLLCRCCC
jgi:hypothetical protein